MGRVCRQPGRRPVALLATLVLAMLPLACREDAQPLMAAFDTPVDSTKSVRETFAFLRTAIQERAFLAVRPYVEPVQRDELVDLLLAIDTFTIDNASALQAAKQACPGLPAQVLAAFDTSVLVETVELAARDVEIVSEREDTKGKAVLVLRVGHLPGEQEVNFRQLDGRWVYVPGPHLEQLVQTFRALATALERVTRALQHSEEHTPQYVESQYQLFVAPLIQRLRSNPEPR